MTDYLLFEHLKNEYNAHMSFLDDKPEENIETTLKACWLAASGLHVSAETSATLSLPQLDENQLQSFSDYLRQRRNQIPLAHITGRQNFMGIEFLSDKRAMIPRKETEVLCRKGLQISHQLSKGSAQVRILDVCCGSGNIGLSIAHYNRSVHVFSTDISEDAISLTLDNAGFLELTNYIMAIQGDLFEAYMNQASTEKVDMIISNPPYISSNKVDKMHEEIRYHEPAPAFDGGRFGMDIIQRLILESPSYLKKDGWLLFEVGSGQGEFAMELCRRSDEYKNVMPIPDHRGVTRGVMAQKN